MRFEDYMKDRWYRYLSYFIAFAAIVIFMLAFRVKAELILATAVILCLCLAVAEGIEFGKRKSFYDQVAYKLSTLDQKYLITEMLGDGDFYEAKLLMELLRGADKSMCEKIGEYRRNSKEFQDFLELWVHEVKLPLQSLRLAVRNLELEEDAEERLAEQIRRIDFATDKVLYFCRSENPEKDYVIRETDLKKLLSEVIMKHREDLLLHGIGIQTKRVSGTVYTDAKWLSFILSQILANSIKYAGKVTSNPVKKLQDGEMADGNAPAGHNGHKESLILITVKDTENSTILSIRDNGIGIPAQDLPRIFEKSFTGENGRIGAKSTGMGLYLAKKLCDRLGHRIEADSVQGEFTEIRIVFGKNDYFEMIQE